MPEAFYLGLDFQAPTTGGRPRPAVARIVVVRYGKTAAGQIQVSPQCVSFRDLCDAIDALKQDLDSIRDEASVRFAD